MKKSNRIVFSLILLTVMTVFTACEKKNNEAGSGITAAPLQTELPTPEPSPEPTEEPKKGFELHFIDVGMGDAMLLICDGEAMIIDSGNVGYGPIVVDYARSCGVDSLKYLLVTHGHADHVGGMPEIIDAFPFETMFLFDVPCSEEPYKKMLSIIDERKIETVRPEVGSKYNLGSGYFTILTPSKEDKSNLNNNSIGIKFVYGERSFLLLGDIQSGVENQLLKSGEDLKADVWKANHHGSNAGCTKKFIEAVQPQYIVIMVGKNNKYGYPDASNVSRMKKNCEALLRTDENGSVVFTSDGKDLQVRCENPS